MTTDQSEYGTSRAMLIGVSDYEHSGFSPLPAARNSVTAMQMLLADPALCGWSQDQITVISNPRSVSELGIRLTELARETTGVMLLYYVGHGVVTERAELCLTVSSTHPGHPGISGLRWETVRHAFLSSPAKVRVGILDCCFSGRAIEALSGSDEQGLADLADIRGSYVLTASRSNRPAHVPPPHEQQNACTSFTAELSDLVRAGIPGKSDWLSLSDIYPELRQRLTAKGLPAPDRRGTDTADQFAFTANAATRGSRRSEAPAVAPPSRASHQSRTTSVADHMRPSQAVIRANEDLVRNLEDRVFKLMRDREEARAIGDADKAATAEETLRNVRALLAQAIKTYREDRR
ncbi:caspase family protein [Kribbella sp. NPDC050459]|uniref:caspase family protein n=1 Tax=Kribbella sp. NPDC050459 TaxID=3155785 RepID=UPI0033E83AEC